MKGSDGNPPAPPPRFVGLALRWAVLLGGVAQQIGWGLLAFGGWFTWPFARNADWAGLVMPDRPAVRTTGTLTGIDPTRFSEGEGDDGAGPGRRYYAYRYTFHDAQGAEQRGVSYQAAASQPAGSEVGRTVEIEYVADRPQRSHIVGMRHRPFGGSAVCMMVIPAVGVALVFAGLRRGTRGLRLLRDGSFTTGKLIASEGTGVEVGERTVYKLTIEFQSDDGATHTVVARSSEPERAVPSGQAALLYDPMSPVDAVLTEQLPGRPEFDAAGMPYARHPLRAWCTLILPMLSVLGFALWELR